MISETGCMVKPVLVQRWRCEKTSTGLLSRKKVDQDIIDQVSPVTP